MTNICINCNKPTDNAKFCTRSCAASFNNKGTTRNPNGINRKSPDDWEQKIARIERGEILSFTMMRKYIRDTNPICNVCGQGKIFMDKPLVLQCDHIDGNPKNNSLGNLRMLCPNCHTQTDTWGAKKR